MDQHRPLRFGVYAGTSEASWPEQVRRAETLGYDTLAIGEHIFTPLAPISAMASAVILTSTIRISSHTFANDFRNPVMLAREVASLDVLSNGRFDFGIGSGYMRTDYDQTGIPSDPPGQRLGRLFEAVALIKAAFTEETVGHAVEYYSVRGLSLRPRPVQRPYLPLMLGGGGRRMLQFAARETDIVGINVKSTPAGGFDWDSLTPEATTQKIRWVREDAGDRFPTLELNWLVPFAAVTNDPETAARRFIDEFGATGSLSTEALLASPHALVGSEDAIVEMIQQRRKEYGVAYMTLFASEMESFAPVVHRLAGT